MRDGGAPAKAIITKLSCGHVHGIVYPGVGLGG